MVEMVDHQSSVNVMIPAAHQPQYEQESQLRTSLLEANYANKEEPSYAQPHYEFQS